MIRECMFRIVMLIVQAVAAPPGRDRLADCLHGNSSSVAGLGDAAGAAIQRLDFTAGGDHVGVGAPPSCKPCDCNCDGHVNNLDIDPFVAILVGGTPCSACAGDANCDGVANNLDIDPFVACLVGLGGAPCEPPRAPSGTFALHGRPVDVIAASVHNPTELVLMNGRARSYDVRHGRWLQRDRAGYVDGGNLYEAFGSNAVRETDPSGLGSVVDEGNDLTYRSSGLHWTFAKGISARYVLIDHPDWPYAFVVDRDTAKYEFRTLAPWNSDYTHPYEIMQRATYLAVYHPDQVKAVFDKHSDSLAWFEPKDIASDVTSSESRGGDRAARLRGAAQEGLAREVAGVRSLAATAFSVNVSLLMAPTGLGGTIVDLTSTTADVAAGRVEVPAGAIVLTAVASGALLHLRFADTALPGGGALARRGGAELARASVPAELRVSEAIGVPRNVGPGRITIESLTGTAAFRVPDFGPEATIALRGSIVEVKNVTRLQITPQLRDLAEQVKALRAQRPNLVLEIFTNGRFPVRGELADLSDLGLVRITPIP